MSATASSSNPIKPAEGSDDAPEYPVFQPLPGGDQVLRSSDNHDFRVHSVLLVLVSSVFREMLHDEQARGRVIQLNDDKEALSMLLQYIYPGTSPILDNWAHMKKGLAIARAYEVDGFTNELEQQLRRCMNANPSVFEPMKVWNFSNTFGFTEIQESAARLITVSQRDFRRPQVLGELAREHPEASALIRLVGSQGVRAKTLADVLFAFHKAPMFFKTIFGDHLMCSQCIAQIRNRSSYILPA